MKKFRLSFFAAALFALSAALHGCLNPENIVVQDVENVSMQGFSRADLVLRIENKGRKASIESGKFALSRNGSPMIDLMLRDRVEIPRRTTAGIPVSIQIKMSNPLMAISLARDPQATLNTMTVSGEMSFKAGIRKKIRFDNTPFPEFLRTLGVDTNELIRSIQM